jgi:hypothetical protein
MRWEIGKSCLNQTMMKLEGYMKAKNINCILLAALLIFTTIPACRFTTSPATSQTNSPTTSTQTSSITSPQPSVPPPASVPTWIPSADGNLGSITYTLDSSRQVSATFDFNAGKDLILTTKDTNGYAWMLYIPADGLLTDQKITLTPFATMDVSHSAARIISGVQLEPDGMQFVNAVRLSVTAPMDNPGIGLIFSMNQDGSHVMFAPTTNTSGGKTAIANIWHFSSAGYTNGSDAGGDAGNQYQQMAREQYRLALDAAKQFIRNGAPPPPTSPSISMFCRGTEVNPDQNEAYEYMREFLDPYSDYVYVLLGAIKDLQLTHGLDVDTSAGVEAIITILQMAEKTLLELGNQYMNDKPPDRLVAAIFTGLNIERNIQLINGNTPLLLVPEKISSWASRVRNYYLDELKTKHDYRAFPTILTLEKWAQLVGGQDRLEEVLGVMTFNVVLDTSFDGNWISSGKSYATGHVEQQANIQDITSQMANDLWGDLNNLTLLVKSGTFTNPTGTYTLGAGNSYHGQLWLKNWDACVTKTFDVVLSGFSGVEDIKGRNSAGAASRAGLAKYWWEAGFFMFSVDITNLNKKLGDQTFSGSGSAADGAFTGSGKIHIVINHTPK